MSWDVEAEEIRAQDEPAQAERTEPPSTRPIDPPSRVRYLVLVWLCVATTIAYIDRGCVSVAEKLIRADLGLTEVQMGLVMSAFFLTYAFFQLPAAWADQVYGSRRALPAFAAAWSFATALCAGAGGLGLLVASRLAMGAAEAGIFPSATAVLGRWFPAARRATVSGVLGSFMGVGGAVGAALSGVVLALVPWRWMFVLYAVPGLVWSVGFARWFRNRPQDHPGVNAAEAALIAGDASPAADRPAAALPWRRLLAERAVVGLASQQFFRAAGAIFYMSWFPTYLRETRGVAVLEAGLLTSLPHWAMVAGSLAGGWLSDRVLARSGSLRAARQGVAVLGLVAATACVGLAYVVPNTLLAVLVLSVGSFAASLAGPSAYALTMDLGGRHTGLYFGVMNTAGAVGSVLFPGIAPWLVKATGSWDSVLALFAAVQLAAGASWLLFDADRPTTAT